jgi:hypothetical protein
VGLDRTEPEYLLLRKRRRDYGSRGKELTITAMPYIGLVPATASMGSEWNVDERDAHSGVKKSHHNHDDTL